MELIKKLFKLFEQLFKFDKSPEEVITEMVVIRTDIGNAYLCRESYEGPVLILG